MRRGTILLLFFVLLLVFSRTAQAHPEGYSGFRLLIYQDKAKALISLHTRDLDDWFPPGKFTDYVNDILREVVKSPDDLLELRFGEQKIEPIDKRATLIEPGLIQVELTYPIATMPKEMTVWSKHLARMPYGHQQLFFAEDMRATPELAGGSSLYEATLDTSGDNATFDIPMAPRAISQSATSPSTAPAPAPAPIRRISFLLLGVEHIVTGYDHLLFLAALLLVCKSFKEAAAIVTFFTVAHTFTLTLAALDIITLPSRIVEPAIAASILYVGIENIVGKHRFAWRAAVTFAFGLVHGLGFAGALRELGLGKSSVGIAWPLTKFTIGLEAGQLVIAAVLLQVLLAMKKRPAFDQKWVPACSIVISLVGGYWLVTRVLSGP